MSSLEKYHIDLKNLKADNETFKFQIDDSFFDAIGEEVRKGCVEAAVKVKKVATEFHITVSVKGIVNIPCDLCLEEMQQPVEGSNDMTVVWGDEDSEKDDLVMVDERKGFIDMSWFIYELIVLAIPIKHVHEPGKCDPAMMKALEEHSVDRSNSGGPVVDPRWSELEKLKTILND